MGQGESTAEGEQNQETKTCYYEILGIEKTATQDEIDKAYKKTALKLHPDKNRDRDTTPLFQACQEAYSVLSDPHERQWYDDHRDQILKGVDPEQAKEEDSSYITPKDLIKFVTPRCYNGFDPNTKGNFFEVYRELFKQIDKEEELEEAVDEDHDLAPNFGDAGTHIDDVLEFYKFWEVFGTKKEFSYMDKYNTKDARNGRERRYIQTENRKERQTEKKKFNQTVRDILEFVRKRDPRYQKWKSDLEEEKERKKKAEAEKKRKAAIKHQKKLEEYREKMRKEYEEMEDQLEEEVVVEHKIICEICNKTFKTEGAFSNHCNSKKHKQKVAKFGAAVSEKIDEKTEEKLQELDQEIRKQQEEEEEEKIKEIHNEYVHNEQEQAKRRKELKKQKKKQKAQERKAKKAADALKEELDYVEEEKSEGESDSDAEGEESEDESEKEEEYVSKNKLLKMKKQAEKKRKQQMKSGKYKAQQDEDADDDETKTQDTQNSKQNKKQNKKNKKKKKQVYANQLAKNEENKSENTKEEADNNEEEEVPKKKRRRRAKKDKNQDGDNEDESKKGSQFHCRVCNNDFGTKNKLFKHLKQTGHASAK